MRDRPANYIGHPVVRMTLFIAQGSINGRMCAEKSSIRRHGQALSAIVHLIAAC